MSTSPHEREAKPQRGASAAEIEAASAAEIEAVATELVALVEEFEAAIRGGHVPPAFAERLAELRQTAERLMDA
jgi:hypothetical protein